ncbi:acyl-CoA dehydrogenase family protein [Sphingomonas sp. LaA6.9]|uniref:acyl-CoA dehydrogenase family protein n=1 Tax=Sphingomonas sp. LaA6.9 TaxID=2919914 RepID=UPI001F4FB870|nr:acyl-CoA dehydrogenase family protein [Sphingomonas sp. LaA6.9]MCJ8158709.1 acyl-CoA dehydrogenase family protein [Sphingomonas sp. LaA6.9]
MTATQITGLASPALQPMLDDIRQRRKDLHALGHIPQDIVARFQEIGLYRAFVPTQFGGGDMSPAEFLRIIEIISAADGSAGWVASFGFASKYLSSLPAATLAELYRESPDVVFAGAVFPPQAAIAEPGGYRVKGRWGFGSGCMGASLIGVGIKIEGENGSLPRMAVMPRDQVMIEENWDTIGMFATGSHDLVVDDVLVPEEYILIRGAAPSIDTAAYRYPTMAMATQVLAIVGAGVAREAIDEVVRLATRKTSITGAPSMADRPGCQIALAQMEARLCAARAWFYEETEAMWSRVCEGREVTPADIARLRIASTHIAKTGADVTRRAFEMAGTTGIFNSHPLSRLLLDALVVAQHAFMNDATWQSGGAVLLGKTPPPGYL